MKQGGTTLPILEVMGSLEEPPWGHLRRLPHPQQPAVGAGRNGPVTRAREDARAKPLPD
jgi:hypothetical protein